MNCGLIVKVLPGMGIESWERSVRLGERSDREFILANSNLKCNP
jgi:hypothetical protein